MSKTESTKVDGIIKALSGLEDKLDSLNLKVADMKKSLNTKAYKEIEKMMVQTTQMATKEAEAMILLSKEKAKTEAAKILQVGEKKLTKIKTQIDSKFDEAVDHVVSTILKA